MRLAILVLALISNAFGQSGNLAKADSDGLTMQLYANAGHIRMSDDVVLTAFFRSREKKVTLWSALGWSSAAGLYLEVFDSSGSKVSNSFAPPYDPIPPDLSGKDALISIGGSSFAGFDSKIPASLLFPKPGTYTLKGFYSPPLSRNYFRGHTIWGKEDGTIESPALRVTVDAR